MKEEFGRWKCLGELCVGAQAVLQGWIAAPRLCSGPSLACGLGCERSQGKISFPDPLDSGLGSGPIPDVFSAVQGKPGPGVQLLSPLGF